MADSPGVEPIPWRWGDPQFRYAARGRDRVMAYLTRRWGAPTPQRARVPGPLRLPASRLSELDFRSLTSMVSRGEVRHDDRSRLLGSVGASYLDLVRLRNLEVPDVADAVAEPSTIEEVEALVHWADRERVAIVPRSGGTSVVGGLDPLRNGHRAVVVVSDRRLSGPGEIRPEARLGSFGAGILGPVLEARLREFRLTLGHFPQSFERSALGGWVAARSFGQASTRYRTPADRLEGFTLVTPKETVRWTRTGQPHETPDPGTVVPGSEGTLGILTEATVTVEPLPKATIWSAALFPAWSPGVVAMRRLVSTPPVPAVLRLSDGDETDLVLAESSWEMGGRFEPLRRIVARLLRFRSEGPRSSCLMIASYEGSVEEAEAGRRAFQTVRRESAAGFLPASVARAWERSRFRTPYLRDDLIERGWFVETFETFVPWSILGKVDAAARAAVRTWAGQCGIRACVTAHLSHPEVGGTSLYFTVIAPLKPGEEEASWWSFKQLTAEAVVSAGGTVSHHHGIGRYHRTWASRSLALPWLEGLRTLKARWDPNGVMNPGKTLPEG